MGILYNPQNVVVGMATGYFSPAGTPMPANTVAAFGDWGTLWKQAGATEEGWRFGGDSSTTPHNIEEQPNPAAVTLESRGINITAALAEDTLDSLRLAFGGGTITTTPAGAGVGVVDEFKLSDNVDVFAVGLDLQTVGGKTRRIYVPRASGSGNVDVAFRRSAAKRTWPVAFAALCKPSEIIIRDITPVAGP
jgi:hypothetical protein